MTEREARTLRNNAAKVYRQTRLAFYTLADYLLSNITCESASEQPSGSHPTQPQVQEIVDQLWTASGLEDTFHELGSQGYRQLIHEGWTPYKTDDEWTPSPDCIDNPTTRGGASDV